MWLRFPPLATALAALALAGCGADDAELIPPRNSEQLTALVGEAGDAFAAGECDRARRAVVEAEAELAGLPRKTNKRLKANIRQWLDHVDEQIAADCRPPEAEDTPTPTPTLTETPTPTPTPTPTATETPTPTPTATADPGDGGDGGGGNDGGDDGGEEPPATGGVPGEDG